MGESKWEKEGRKRSPSCKEVDCWKRCINNEANRAGNDYDQQQKKLGTIGGGGTSKKHYKI